MEETNVREILLEIHQKLKPLSELSASIITQAELQAYTENLYNQLVQVAYDGINYVKKLEVGQTVTQEMLDERDMLVARAQRLILDAPNAR
ncbi:hypothetical protein [Dictyobacter formicarum]|uniref:Uncharacterized protein n=1 Tax=Dictyobacter formicarum TaxID=2778368 RepID=A0ABQ3VMK0_9CHLR|nr:hypothetical protein [Dictyobacter formicarum]GHO86621.1 hypothetical protein KSZ_46270 [Dictyobacter formicarum]